LLLPAVEVEVGLGVVNEVLVEVLVDLEQQPVFQYHPVHLLQSPLVQVVLLGLDNQVQVVYLPMVVTEITQFLAL
jgi:hypothetical protein